MAKMKVKPADRCQSRFVNKRGNTVQCSKKSTHTESFYSERHGNETPGVECAWTTEQEISA